jgi:hypothetical protein
MRTFFLKHELDFLAAFHWFSGACAALIFVAAAQNSTGCFVDALICFALSAAIWIYGYKLARDRVIEHLERSGRGPGCSS